MSSTAIRVSLVVDLKLLDDQKQLLLAMAKTTTAAVSEPIMGIVHLLDQIQDQAVDGNCLPESDVFPAIDCSEGE